jgi:uncharacterized membrane protein YkvA (DUF1232 family)
VGHLVPLTPTTPTAQPTATVAATAGQTMPPPQPSNFIGWNFWFVGLVLLGTIIYSFLKCKSDQSNNAAATMFAALFALCFVSPTDVIHDVAVVIGVVVVLFFGIRSINTAEAREVALKASEQQHRTERNEDKEAIAGLQSDVRTLVVTMSHVAAGIPVTGSVNVVLAPATLNATGTVKIVWWPDQQYLKDQVADLIRNCRTAAEALRLTTDETYVEVLTEIAGPFVGPSIKIRQAIRRILGFPLAEPLNHLPPGTTPEEFDTIAEVHERLFKSIPDNVPAVPLTDSE